MPFCTSCGADVTNKRFCVGCGTPINAEPAAPAAVAAPAPVATRKVSPIIWILGGILALGVLVIVVVASAGLFLAHKMTQNPALATARILAAANPDIEILSSDSGNNTVTFKDKRTGETVTMNFDDIKKGKIVFKGKDGEATLQAHSDGHDGTVEVDSPQGTVKFGAGSARSIPKWVPAYPGVNPEVNFSMQGTDAEGGTFHFETKDSAATVLTFYENGLKAGGFNITANVSGNIAASSGAMLAAEDSAKRTVMITVGTGSSTTVNVVYGTKK